MNRDTSRGQNQNWAMERQNFNEQELSLFNMALQAQQANLVRTGPFAAGNMTSEGNSQPDPQHISQQASQIQPPSHITEGSEIPGHIYGEGPFGQRQRQSGQTYLHPQYNTVPLRQSNSAPSLNLNTSIDNAYQSNLTRTTPSSAVSWSGSGCTIAYNGSEMAVSQSTSPFYENPGSSYGLGILFNSPSTETNTFFPTTTTDVIRDLESFPTRLDFRYSARPEMEDLSPFDIGSGNTGETGRARADSGFAASPYPQDIFEVMNKSSSPPHWQQYPDTTSQGLQTFPVHGQMVRTPSQMTGMTDNSYHMASSSPTGSGLDISHSAPPSLQARECLPQHVVRPYVHGVPPERLGKLVQQAKRQASEEIPDVCHRHNAKRRNTGRNRNQTCVACTIARKPCSKPEGVPGNEDCTKCLENRDQFPICIFKQLTDQNFFLELLDDNLKTRALKRLTDKKFASTRADQVLKDITGRDMDLRGAGEELMELKFGNHCAPFFREAHMQHHCIFSVFYEACLIYQCRELLKRHVYEEWEILLLLALATSQALKFVKKNVDKNERLNIKGQNPTTAWKRQANLVVFLSTMVEHISIFQKILMEKGFFDVAAQAKQLAVHLAYHLRHEARGRFKESELWVKVHISAEGVQLDDGYWNKLYDKFHDTCSPTPGGNRLPAEAGQFPQNRQQQVQPQPQEGQAETSVADPEMPKVIVTASTFRESKDDEPTRASAVVGGSSPRSSHSIRRKRSNGSRRGDINVDECDNVDAISMLDARSINSDLTDVDIRKLGLDDPDDKVDDREMVSYNVGHHDHRTNTWNEGQPQDDPVLNFSLSTIPTEGIDDWPNDLPDHLPVEAKSTSLRKKVKRRITGGWRSIFG